MKDSSELVTTERSVINTGEIKKRVIILAWIIVMLIGVFVLFCFFMDRNYYRPIRIPSASVSEKSAILDLRHALILGLATGEECLFYLDRADRHSASYVLWTFPTNNSMLATTIQRGDLFYSWIPYPGGARMTVTNEYVQLDWYPPTTVFINSTSVWRHALIPFENIKIKWASSPVPWISTEMGGCR